MTYPRQFTAFRIALGLLYTLTAIMLASWAITPVVGTAIGVGYPILVAGLIWWRWSFDRTTPKRWMLTGGIVGVLVLMASAGWSAADTRGLELVGKVTTSMLASLFFLLLLLATNNKTQGRNRET